MGRSYGPLHLDGLNRDSVATGADEEGATAMRPVHGPTSRCHDPVRYEGGTELAELEVDTRPTTAPRLTYRHSEVAERASLRRLDGEQWGP